MNFAIIIFVLGFIINELIRRWNKSNELSQRKQFIEEWVEKSNETLTEYIKSLRLFSNELKVNSSFNFAQWKTGMIYLTRINSISMKEYSDIYIFGLDKNINNENRKQLMNFLFQLEYIDKTPAIISNIYECYCNESENIRGEWNLYYIQLIDLFQFDILNLDINEKQIYNQIKSLLLPLLRNAHENKKIYNVVEWKKEFIIPAMDILSKNKEDISSLILQINKLIKGLYITITKHDNLNLYYNVFDDYAKNLEFAQESINKSKEYFKHKKIKKFCL